jgi:hypothetical protein
MPDVESKSLAVQLKLDDDQPGLVVATFAAFDEVDKEGDVTKKGAFGSQEVLLGAYGHTSFGRYGPAQPPVGRGKIHEDAKRAIFEGQFNLNMAAGREMYESVKMTGELQDWSYGFRTVKESSRIVEGRPVRVLEELLVTEVSPVMIGAGNSTATLGIKAVGLDLTLEEHTDVALAAWSDYLARLKSLADLRAKDGRVLSAANRSRLSKLAESLREIDAEISQLLESTDPADKSAAVAAYAAFLKIEHRLRGGVAVGA